MAIKITQPFGFDAQLPNFDRDIIDSSTYSNSSPLMMTDDEKSSANLAYDIGHVVYDTYTERHYIWLGESYGWGEPSVSTIRVRFADVDTDSEVLYLDNTARRLGTGMATVTYVPVDSQPSDWGDNWNEYYIYDTVSKSFVNNPSSTYSPTQAYYVQVIVA